MHGPLPPLRLILVWDNLAGHASTSIVTWLFAHGVMPLYRTTEYYGLAVTEMRAQGRQVEDEILAHISPAHSENVNFFGTIAVDVEHELAKLDPSGYRPLRERNSAPASILV